MEIIDNLNRKLKDDMIVTLKQGSKVAIAASCFSIYAYQELKEQLGQVDQLRFIFTEPAFLTDKTDSQRREFYIPRLSRERELLGSEFEIRLRNELSMKAVAKECAEWIRQKACFKSNRTNAGMPSFASVDDVTYMPLNGFSTVELGCERGNNIATAITKLEAPLSKHYLQLFDQIWSNDDHLQTVTDQVIQNITKACIENSPEYIYFVTLYNIFNEFLEDISEDVLPNEATGFKQSAVWNKLYNFQKDASLAIINKLEKYNGCILADSVGLGKTFTALSVIKYYEGRNRNVLVLCPKKLYENWAVYRSNYTNNPLQSDRLRYDILYHTDLSRDRGTSNGTDLELINWGNYDLVVIDESHNFRNGGKISDGDEDERENRYLRLMNRVIKSGVKTKVLMLSATPVNNRFNDLKNQLALAYEDDSRRMAAMLNTEANNLEDIFRQAQAAFNIWSAKPEEERTTQALLDSLSFDFFKVLDAVTIARSRKHIEHYYDTTDIGKFPTRLAPMSRRPDLTDLNSAVSYNEIFQTLSELNLAVYSPSEFILPSCLYKYETTDDGGGLTRSGRERGIRQLMSINLLKRLESSVNSFRLTLTRIQQLLQDTLSAIGRVEQGDSGKVADYDFADGLDLDEMNDSVFIGGKKSQIDLRDMDYISWRKYLESDLHEISALLLLLKDITPEHDSKLQQLKADLRNKFENPINGTNRKVIIFTAFADTAQYLYDNLAQTILDKHGLHTALVTGTVEARSTLRLINKGKPEALDFNKVLTLFSPISKGRDAVYPNIKAEIDVLIATDCISEGQNLQDCDYLINYDIHWNPVRIIQRFGRVDRIGSRNEYIQLVNYWPNMDLDEYINLKGRVEARMKVSVMTSTGDDNPLSNDEKGDLEYRRKQLERLQTEVVDLEEMNSGISIMDLGLNEFRLDLLAYMKANGDIDHIPSGIHALATAAPSTPRGVVFVLKNRNNAVNIDRKNRLHPFYMVYVSNESEVVVDHLHPKELLDKMRLLCKGNNQPVDELCRKFNAETGEGQRMGAYSKLLGDAIASIINVKQSSDLSSFFEGESGCLFGNEIRGLDDFELICFLIIR